MDQGLSRINRRNHSLELLPTLEAGISRYSQNIIYQEAKIYYLVKKKNGNLSLIVSYAAGPCFELIAGLQTIRNYSNPGMLRSTARELKRFETLRASNLSFFQFNSVQHLPQYKVFRTPLAGQSLVIHRYLP